MMELEPRVALLQDLRLQTFDSIRFASYRTASKLRYIQKSTNLHLVDIWNVIEAFRENGLNTLEPQSDVSVARLETLVSSLYHNLNKRLPTAQQVPVDSKAGLLLNWLLAAYTTDNSGKIRVFSIKVALATMCSGKLVDKLRYIFSQISDGAGQLVNWKLAEFLKEVLALPAAVYESPTFHYTDGLEEQIFPSENKITVNDFMATLMSEPGPSCLVWLPLLHRLATVETIVHPTICSVCHKENFTGFRYRCQRCHAYQLCQECFWHGKTSLNHQNDHEVKEYSSYKSPSKQIGHSLRKSFRCVPEKTSQVLPRFPEQPEKTLNLSHIVPPSPLPSHNGFADPSLLHGLGGPGIPGGGGGGIGGLLFDRSSTLDSRATGRSVDSANGGGTSSSRVAAASANDEEHRLIARYAARLAQENRAPSNTSNTDNIASDNSRAQRELISQLECKNKEIMREIARLRRQQEAEQMAPENPALINELRALRQRKGELEGHLGALQDSRRQLMEQLEGLMRMLKNQQTSSPRSTPNSSPRSGKSPPMPMAGSGGGGGCASGGGSGGLNTLGTSPMGSLLNQMSSNTAGGGHSMLGSSSAAGSVLRMQQASPLNQNQFGQNPLDATESRGGFNSNGSGIDVDEYFNLDSTNEPSNNDQHRESVHENDSSSSAHEQQLTHETKDEVHESSIDMLSTLLNDLNTDLLRHIEGDESAEDLEENEEDEAYDDFDLDYNFGLSLCDSSGISSSIRHLQQQQQQQQQLLHSSNDHDFLGSMAAALASGAGAGSVVGGNNHLLLKDLEYRLDHDSEVELDSDFDIDEEHAHINRVMGYKHYPEVLIDDADAGFPLLHEIDFEDPQQTINVDWNDKQTNSASSQWQEQFAQWSLHTQKN
ncbi:dystrobrevin beta [Musca vetustissima]|uniref:dystrobrevin beta n=1 Tax=Musca vetustissima TaxID=27455 RepID=UPI002AB7919D|nr:dystrobrevin beta [Musca vetustissima]